MEPLQTAYGPAGNTNTFTASFADAPTAGNMLLFLVTRGSATATVTAPDGLTKKGDGGNNGSHCGADVYYRVAVADDGTDWEFSSTATYGSVIALEIPGVDGDAPFPDAIVWSSATDSLPSGSDTPSVSGLAISFCQVNQPLNITLASAGTPWSDLVTAAQTFHQSSVDWTDTFTVDSSLDLGITGSGNDDEWLATVFVVAATASGATVPGAPTGVTVVGGDGQATVSFDAPTDDGGASITGYTVTATDSTTSANGGQTGTGAASPITVTGLTNGDAYTFTVVATNSVGDSAASSASSSVTPAAPQSLVVDIWDGTAWVSADVHIYVGGAWVAATSAGE